MFEVVWSMVIKLLLDYMLLSVVMAVLCSCLVCRFDTEGVG